mmetsp:Transcript_38996/g.76658  ORF Transcript_38996/g.76658 Transcript_38996/m.76658 type:complete len:96 (+) Transcript_38996:1015-1302(+)
MNIEELHKGRTRVGQKDCESNRSFCLSICTDARLSSPLIELRKPVALAAYLQTDRSPPHHEEGIWVTDGNMLHLFIFFLVLLSFGQLILIFFLLI